MKKVTNSMEIDIIDRYLSGNNISEIARYYKISTWSIRHALIRNNIEIRKLYIINDEEKEKIIKMYLDGFSMVKIAEKFRRSRIILSKIIKNANIEIRNSAFYTQQYRLNENFFETIDTEAKAYWLGFITADGNMYNGAMSLALKKSDKRHLEKFLENLESDYPIRPMKNNERVIVSNNKIYKDLKKLGVHENKSFTVKPCELIPEHLKRHYYRGLIDGDGSIYAHSKNSKESFYISLVGSKYIVKSFANFISSKIKTKAKAKQRRNIYAVYYGGNYIVKQIVKLLYSNSNIYLDRKKQLANKILKTPCNANSYIRDNINRDMIIKAYEINKSWKITANILRCSTCTLRLLRKKYNIKI